MHWNLAQELDQLQQQNLKRRLRVLESPQAIVTRFDGREVINFSSNDYLGLANSEVLKQAMVEGVQQYGAGSGASRLVCGTLEPHARLEAALATFKGSESALLFGSGFSVPLGVIPALVGRGDFILLDKLCHASLIDAARLSGATLRVFPHNHLGKLEHLLQTCQGRVLVVTESVFSMDGDIAPLLALVELKDRYGAWLMVDEAHAVGLLGPQGRGLAAAHGLGHRIELQMGTLSKAFGLSGGYIAAAKTVIDLLISKARSFIYSTAPSPALAHAACAALQLIQSAEGDSLRGRLQTHASHLSAWLHEQRLASHPGGSATQRTPIMPIIVGAEEDALRQSAALFDQGFLVPAIRFPTVARGQARLRVTLSSAHEEEHLQRFLAALHKIGAKSPPRV